MQLAIDALDRLVALVEEQGGRVRGSVAARQLFAIARAPEGLARTLLEPLVEGDARLQWRGPFVTLAEASDPPLAETTFVVFDLETTGLASASARICEIGAVRVSGLEIGATFETLVAPRAPLPPAISSLTGLSDDVLSRAPGVESALHAFSTFAADGALVAHNARFDVGFVNRELGTGGSSLAGVVIDTVPLARTLLAGRIERTSLAALSCFFGVSVRPCHRALPDAQATAEVFLRLVELARERGAGTLSDLEELAAPRPRRIHAKRRLIVEAPARPGVYLFVDRDGGVLYVGKARDLRVRLRSYFHTPRQRASVEAALDALERIEWRVFGSEIAAALEEIRLIRRLRPPANTRTPRPERYVYLHRRGSRVVLSRAPSRYGPIRRTLEAREAARALRGCSAAEFEALLDGDPVPRLRYRLAELSLQGRDLELHRLRRQVSCLEHLIDRLGELDRLRRLAACILAPGQEPETLDAFVIAAGRVSLVPLGRCGSPADASACLTRALPVVPRDPPPIEADRLDELLVAASFLAKPPPELQVVELRRPGGWRRPDAEADCA